jgi:hypothetical protein
MPKLLCPCGYIHDMSPIPDAGWVTIRDKDYDCLIQTEVQRADLAHVNPALSDREIVNVTGVLYECPDCGRLLWRQPGASDWLTYVPVKTI